MDMFLSYMGNVTDETFGLLWGQLGSVWAHFGHVEDKIVIIWFTRFDLVGRKKIGAIDLMRFIERDCDSYPDW